MNTIICALGIMALVICIVQCGSSPMENPRNLIDFPVELQMMIYKNLNLTDLIQLSKTHPHIQAIVELSFKDKYSGAKFEIRNYNKIIGTVILSKDITEEIDCETILKTFEMLGHLIRKLRVYYRPYHQPKQNLQRLNEHINKYLSESLTDITLGYLDDDYLVGLEMPFTKVENLTLASGSIYKNNTDFSKMFPVVRRLDLYGMEYMNPGNLEYHFPHLEFIQFENRFISHGPNDLATLEQRLKLNPQLRHLAFFWANLKVLEVVSKNSLERLNIYKFDASLHLTRKDIHFNNLKAFTIQIDQTVPDVVERIPVTFGNLEEFTCWKSIDLWFDIIVQNKKLKKLNMGYLVDEKITQMINHFPDLEEFTINFQHKSMQTDNSIKILRKFIDGANKLEKFTFWNAHSDTSDALISQFTPKWNVTTEGNQLIFRRKLIHKSTF